MTMIMYDTVAQQPLDPTIPSLELGQQMPEYNGAKTMVQITGGR